MEGYTKEIINRYGTRDPFELANLMGILVFFEDLGLIKGYYNRILKSKQIHINNRSGRLEQRFTAAHELGHSILHPDSNTLFLKSKTYLCVDKMEIDANIFAVNLLIPDELLKEYNGYSVCQLSKLVGYHERLIELRVKCSR